MRRSSPNQASAEPQVLALAALGWILEEAERAQRLLSLTGLSPDHLRSGLGDPALLGAVMEFLVNHEPDLLRCAEALAVTPEEIVRAAGELAP